MSGSAEATEEAPKKGGKGMLIVTGVLLVVGAAGGFFLPQSGLLSSAEEPAAKEKAYEAKNVFVPVDPIVVSLGPAAANRHLSFRAQLEVPEEHASSVTAMMPRFVDVLNGYLRAIDVRELDDPLGLIRMRGQMLRRVQLMAGDGHVSDLLVMEFVLN